MNKHLVFAHTSGVFIHFSFKLIHGEVLQDVMYQLWRTMSPQVGFQNLEALYVQTATTILWQASTDALIEGTATQGDNSLHSSSNPWWMTGWPSDSPRATQ